MKVIVFENEIEGFQNSFEALNIIYFDGKIEYSYYPKLEMFKSHDDFIEYDFAIVDLELAEKSDYDGFQVIEIINTVKGNKESNKPEIIILSGKRDLLSTLENRKDFNYPILLKPIDYEKFVKTLKSRLT